MAAFGRSVAGMTNTLVTRASGNVGRHAVAELLRLGHPVRARRFFEWLEAAKRDFTAIGDARDTDGMLDQTALALGIRAARAAKQTVATAAIARRAAVTAGRIPAGSDRFA